MSNKIQAGRKPVAQKAQTPNPYATYYSQSILDVDAKTKAEFAEKGLECRWIDAKEFNLAGNLHKHHWRPYKRQASPADAQSHDILSWSLGNDPEGFIRRKGLILAVRPIELGDAHRASIAERTERLHSRSLKKAAEEINETARRAGLKTAVDSEYDD
jgi:hypothetical protein